MPSNLAEAMIRLLDHSSNEGLAILSQVLCKGEHALGNLWTDQLSQQAAQDLRQVNTVLPGLDAQFRAAQPNEQTQLPTIVDPQLLEGTTVNFPRSLVRLAWILQHAVTLLPMAGDIQAVLNSQTAGVSDIHAWGLMLPSSSRVSPITIQLLRSDTRTSADASTVPGNWEASLQAESLANPQDSNSYYGTPMPESTVWSR